MEEMEEEGGQHDHSYLVMQATILATGKIARRAPGQSTKALRFDRASGPLFDALESFERAVVSGEQPHSLVVSGDVMLRDQRKRFRKVRISLQFEPKPMAGEVFLVHVAWGTQELRPYVVRRLKQGAVLEKGWGTVTWRVLPPEEKEEESALHAVERMLRFADPQPVVVSDADFALAQRIKDEVLSYADRVEPGMSEADVELASELPSGEEGSGVRHVEPHVLFRWATAFVREEFRRYFLGHEYTNHAVALERFRELDKLYHATCEELQIQIDPEFSLSIPPFFVNHWDEAATWSSLSEGVARSRATPVDTRFRDAVFLHAARVLHQAYRMNPEVGRYAEPDIVKSIARLLRTDNEDYVRHMLHPALAGLRALLVRPTSATPVAMTELIAQVVEKEERVHEEEGDEGVADLETYLAEREPAVLSKYGAGLTAEHKSYVRRLLEEEHETLVSERRLARRRRQLQRDMDAFTARDAEERRKTRQGHTPEKGEYLEMESRIGEMLRVGLAWHADPKHGATLVYKEEQSDPAPVPAEADKKDNVQAIAPIAACIRCGANDAQGRCPGCKMAYCGRKCQVEDWDKGGHETKCQGIARTEHTGLW